MNSEEQNNQLSATDQKEPIHNTNPAVWELVIKDMTDRDEWGRSKYKTPLQTFNGRNALVDLYQELLDGVVYCRQEIEESNNILDCISDAIYYLSDHQYNRVMNILENLSTVIKNRIK